MEKALSENSELSHASVLEVALQDMAKQRGFKATDQVEIMYWDSVAEDGELTACSRVEDDLHEYSQSELAAMEAGEFERPVP